MRIKTLKSGFSLPIFGIGTWMMGGSFTRDPSNDDARDIRAIQEAIRRGITHIDTAEIYASGHAERIVSQALKGAHREDLIIVSKVWNDSLEYDQVINAVAKSLARIGIDYLDLYLIHKPSPLVPLSETMRALDVLVAEGLLKNIGVSNFSVDRMREAQSLTKNKIVATQVHYNLIFREPELKGVLQYCQENDVLLIAWRPVEKGMLASGGVPLVEKMCQKYQKTAAQIAINWLISQANVVTISTMRSPQHLDENLGALEWQMSDDDVELLRDQFPNQEAISDAVALV